MKFVGFLDWKVAIETTKASCKSISDKKSHFHITLQANSPQTLDKIHSNWKNNKKKTLSDHLELLPMGISCDKFVNWSSNSSI